MYSVCLSFLTVSVDQFISQFFSQCPPRARIPSAVFVLIRHVVARTYVMDKWAGHFNLRVINYVLSATPTTDKTISSILKKIVYTHITLASTACLGRFI